MSSNNFSTAFVAALLSILCFVTIGLFVRALHDSINISLITFYRAFFAFVFILVITPFFDRSFLQVTGKDIKQYAIVGFFLAITMTLFNAALTLAPLTDVYFLFFIHVFVAPVLAMWFLHERFTPKNGLLTLLGLIGIALINPFTGQNILGSLLTLGAGTSYALMTVYMRKVDKTHALGDVVWFMGFAALFLFPFAWKEGLLSIPSNDWMLVIGMGMVSTGLGYFFYNVALKRLRVHVVSMMDLIITTIASIALSVWIFAEPLNWNVLVGGIVIVMVGLLFALEAHLLDAGLKLPLMKNSLYDLKSNKRKDSRTRTRPTPGK